MELFLQQIGAINDPTRLRILATLDVYGPLCVCVLQEHFGMIQSRLSRHLKILKEAKWIQVERRGTWAYYGLVPSEDPFVLATLEKIRALDLITPLDSQGCKV